MRNLLRQNRPIEECKNCSMIVERNTWDEKDYIDNLLLAQWTKCNSNCIYCGCAPDSNNFPKNNSEYYDITPAIKDMIEQGILIQSAKIDFAGGEPTIYPEFETLLTLFIEKGFKNLFINTSGIKYSNTIEYALKSNSLNLLTISVDAGSCGVHKQIKRTNSYKIVWDNIKKYSIAQKSSNNNFQFCLKYIILPEINDTKEEIDLFLEKVKKAEVNFIAISLDMYWWEENKNNKNENIIKLVQYFIEQAKNKYNFKVELYPWIRWLIGLEEV
jgi:wyosine [tRNA(Phe)-imidazoG37] synthetase (radical SAM superfamily)